MTESSPMEKVMRMETAMTPVKMMMTMTMSNSGTMMRTMMTTDTWVMLSGLS